MVCTKQNSADTIGHGRNYLVHESIAGLETQEKPRKDLRPVWRMFTQEPFTEGKIDSKPCNVADVEVCLEGLQELLVDSVLVEK